MSENNFWGAWLVPTQKIRGSFWIIHTKKAKRTSFENQKKPFHQCYGCICVVCFKPKIAHFQAKTSISCAVNWISIVENMNSKRKLSQERDECSSSSEKNSIAILSCKVLLLRNMLRHWNDRRRAQYYVSVCVHRIRKCNNHILLFDVRKYMFDFDVCITSIHFDFIHFYWNHFVYLFICFFFLSFFCFSMIRLFHRLSLALSFYLPFDRL